MEISNRIASDITIHSKYARHLHAEKRRETWEEIVERDIKMHVKKYPAFEREIRDAFEFVRQKKVLPSMRSLQFGGRAIELNNSRVYNCGYLAASEAKFFSELMFMLLGGTGVGYSVQSRHISSLPSIKQPGKERKFLIQDSIVGWADSVKVLVAAYLEGKYLPRFDFSDIRPKGSLLKTAGGKAPGPGPLRTCLARVTGILESKPIGSRLTSVEVSDIACIVADAVLAGGIRRSAMICLFDIDDEGMLAYKTGEWYNTSPQRARVNVSAVAFRQDVKKDHLFDLGETKYGEFELLAKATTKEQFDKFWAFVEASGSGEPGIYWTNHPDWGTNPCCEIALKHKQFCNLTTVNYTDVESQEELNARVKAATIIGTLQASYTDLHYLSEGWRENCEEEALLGVSITGIADGGHFKKFDWHEAATIAVDANAEFGGRIGVEAAARITCIKPEGTASLVLGSSSGIHARHSHYYVRRMRFGKTEPIAQYLSVMHPELVKQDLMKPDGVVVELPQKSPDRSIYRTESPLALLERVKYFHENWVMPGHSRGENSHNVSTTVSVKPDEWKEVGEWMWGNRSSYNGIAVLPYDGGSYVQAPFEAITKDEYEERMRALVDVDLSMIREDEDGTALVDNVACSGGACDLI